MDANVRERLAASKHTTERSHMKRCRKNRNQFEVKEQYSIEILSELENLYSEMDINGP
jgi:hypothetical protein